MAVLSDKATDGRMSFVKYVTENKRLGEIEFEIEKNKTGTLFKQSGNSLSSVKELKSGTKLKIVDKKLYEVFGMKLAKVSVGALAGMVPINVIRKPTGGNGTQYEDEVVDTINAYILNAGGKIDIKLKGDTKIYKDISFAVKVDAALKRAGGVRGDPKADIILCKDKSNPLAKGSIYISHKKEGGPEAFQQYGGLSEQAGIEIYNHKLVQKFLGEVSKFIEGNKLGAPVMGTFSDPVLANMSIYGPDYGKEFSLQHTQLIGQGKPDMRQMGKHVELYFPNHMGLSGDLSHFSGEYLPVFGATYREGRGFDYKGTRYNGARVAIYPQKLMATRSGLVQVKIK